MPAVSLLFYRDRDEVPALEWLAEQQVKPRRKIEAALERLAELGHEAHGPNRPVEYLGDGIYELRVRRESINYRMLFFFYGQSAVILTSGFTKEREIPPTEIRRALERKARFEKDPANHHLGI